MKVIHELTKNLGTKSGYEKLFGD